MLVDSLNRPREILTYPAKTLSFFNGFTEIKILIVRRDISSEYKSLFYGEIAEILKIRGLEVRMKML
jgi:hypothetical protein